MKKLLVLLLSAATVLSLTAAASAAASPEAGAVTVSALNADRKAVEVKVPHDPRRVAVMDMAILDILDNWGLGDRIVGMAKNTYVDYLGAYIDNQDIRNLGTLHESDLEAMMAAEPDVIFIGSRMAKQYDALSKIAPVVFLTVDYEIGLIRSMKNNADTLAAIFGMEDRAKEQWAGFDSRVKSLAATAEGKTAVIGVVTSGGFNTLGNSSRCSLIGGEIGFKNLADNVDATHGNESSFELLVELNPGYIFVLDRDTAIGAKGAQLAREVMENELVQKTDAYKNGRIVYLTPAPWYLAEGGITALNAMLADLEGALK